MKYTIKKLGDLKVGEWFRFSEMWYELKSIAPVHRGVELKELVGVVARSADTTPKCPPTKYRTLHLPPEMELDTHDHLPFF